MAKLTQSQKSLLLALVDRWIAELESENEGIEMLVPRLLVPQMKSAIAKSLEQANSLLKAIHEQ